MKKSITICLITSLLSISAFATEVIDNIVANIVKIQNISVTNEVIIPTVKNSYALFSTTNLVDNTLMMNSDNIIVNIGGVDYSLFNSNDQEDHDGERSISVDDLMSMLNEVKSLFDLLNDRVTKVNSMKSSTSINYTDGELPVWLPNK